MMYRIAPTLILALLLTTLAAPAQALDVMGRLSITVAGFQGYTTTRTEGVDVRVQNVPFQTQPDGFFRVDTLAIVTSMEDLPVKWNASNDNQISLKLGVTKIGIPVDWLGWKVGNFILLQAVTCSVDVAGGAFCTQENEDRAMLMQRYGVRFSVPELVTNQGVTIRSSRDATEPVLRPQNPEVVRPTPVVTPPQILRPLPPLPAPTPVPEKIIGPSD